MRFRTFFGLMVVLLMALNGYADPMQDSINWEGKYEADALPLSSGWSGVQNYFSQLSPGIVEFDTFGTSAAEQIYRNDADFDFSTGASMEWRLKVVEGNGTIYLTIADGTNSVYIGIKDGSLSMADASGTSKSVNTSDDYHIYRITLDSSEAAGNQVQFYMDDEMLFETSITTFGRIDRNIQFGDLTTSSGIDVDLDYIRWTNTGSYAPIPEPMTFVMLAFGGGVVLLRKHLSGRI